MTRALWARRRSPAKRSLFGRRRAFTASKNNPALPCRRSRTMLRFVFVALTLTLVWAIPAAAAENSQPGLIATYSQGDFRLVTVVPTPAFSLKENESIHPQPPAA